MRTNVCLATGVAVLVVAGLAGSAWAEDKPAANPVVVMKTNLGVIKLELFQDKAPLTVKNFLSYVDDKYYDGTTFHRVAPGAMIQGGKYNENFEAKPAKEPVKNEASAENKNLRGTIALLLNQNKPDSGTQQFLINVRDNARADKKADTPAGLGSCVFGKVIEGLDVVEKISNVAVGTKNNRDKVPVETVKIESVTRAAK